MVFEKVREVICEQLNVLEKDVTQNTSFKDDLEADSLDVFQMIMALEEKFDIEISNEDAEGINTVGDIVGFIKEQGELD